MVLLVETSSTSINRINLGAAVSLNCPLSPSAPSTPRRPPGHSALPRGDWQEPTTLQPLYLAGAPRPRTKGRGAARRGQLLPALRSVSIHFPPQATLRSRIASGAAHRSDSGGCTELCHVTGRGGSRPAPVPLGYTFCARSTTVAILSTISSALPSAASTPICWEKTITRLAPASR